MRWFVRAVLAQTPIAFATLCSNALRAAVLVALALLPTHAFAQGFILGVRQDYPTGALPYEVAVGDLNGDGMPDIVTPTGGAHSVSVFLNNGNGSYAPKVEYDTGNTPDFIAIADLNGDGRVDLAVTAFGSNAVSVLLGNGLGAFGGRKDYPTGNAPKQIVVGDLNGDGRPDLVILDSSSRAISVLLGTSSGFAPDKQYTTGNGPSGVAVGDLNGDGNLDIVCTNLSDGTLSVFRGDGMGGFAPRADNAVQANPSAIALTDLNGDGKLDAVYIVNPGTPQLTRMLGDGLGGFGAAVNFPTAVSPGDLAVGDVTGDGKVDVVEAGTPSVALVPGDGLGGFTTATTMASTSGTQSVAIADVNGDGRVDVIAPGTITSTLCVYLNGAGLFQSFADVPAGTNPRGLAVADFNSDGKLDVVTSNDNSANLSVFLGNGSGGLGTRVNYATGSHPQWVIAGDLNGDAKPDLVYVSYGSNTVSTLVNSGDAAGTFAPKTTVPVGGAPQGVAMGDVNGDGLPDLVVADGATNALAILIGSGSGSLGAATFYPVGTNPMNVALGDVNGDGKLDAVVANYYSNSISVCPGNGTGGFGTRLDYAAGTNPATPVLADLNGDGRLDIVVTSQSSNNVTMYLQNSTGGLLAAVNFTTAAGPFGCAVGDVNGDGKPDIVTGNYNSQSCSLLLGNGVGGFGAHIDFGLASYGVAVGLGDLNGDGQLDIVAADYGMNFVELMRSRARTKTAVTVNPTLALLGTPQFLTAGVTSLDPVSGVPTGSMKFYDGTTLLGTAPVIGGSAQLAVFASTLGARSIAAAYLGDEARLSSLSPKSSERIVGTASPSILSIRDVTNDQGRSVRVKFRSSPYDFAGSMTPITQYNVYRRVVPGLGLIGGATATASAPTSLPAALRPMPRIEGVLDATWDFVGSVAARADSSYNFVVPTLADSNASGMHRTTFFVSAATASPAAYFDSPADSGYSVDNLPPGTPASFTAAYAGGATHLHWSVSPETDLASYRVYRGTSAGFIPDASSLIATPPDTGFVAAGPAGSYYKLSAVDVNGNESGFAVVTPSTTTDVVANGAVALALDGTRPNPAVGSRFDVAFALPTGEPAQLELLDVSGRRVVSQESAARTGTSSSRSRPPGRSCRVST
jgi:hypothetical protein